jgi:GT2 family glycosyltransferase
LSSGPHVAALQHLVDRLRRRVAFVEGSRFWKVRARWLVARRLAGFPATDVAPSIPPVEFAETMGSLDPYTRWLFANEPREADLARMRELALAFERKPSIAVIVDDMGCDATQTLASVSNQAYPPTTLVRTSQHGADAEAWARFNAALAVCDEDIVAFCDADRVLAPHATFEIALAFNLAPESVAAYGDRDMLGEHGVRSDPVFAPDWSPDTFLSEMYTGTTIFYRREALVRANGFRPGCGGALHYDLALRVLEDTERVEHRPAILVHELRSQTLPKGGPADVGSDADRVVAEALERRGDPGHVVATACPGVRIVRYARRDAGPVEVIVPTRDLPEKLERCLQSVYGRNAGCDLRVTVVDNGSVERATVALLRAYCEREPRRFRVLKMDEPFNFSRLVNAAVRSSDGPNILLLNNDAAFAMDEGIVALLEQARRPCIGAVGARLLYADGALQHAGVVVGIGGFAGHVHRGADPGVAAHRASIAGVRNYAAVTAACMMVRREAFDAVGGFDERLAVEFNDIDFCLKLRRAGLRNIYLPHVVLRHDESSSRGIAKASRASVARERELFREIWRSDTFRDPYYNTNLTLEREDASLAL